MCTIGIQVNDAGFWKTEARSVLIAFLIHELIMFTGVLISVYLDSPKPPKMNVVHYKSSFGKLYTTIAFILYSLISVLYRPDEKFEPDLISNQLINLAYDYKNFLTYRCKTIQYEIVADKNHLEWYKYCNNIDQLLRQHRSTEQICFPNEEFVTDFTFLKRTERSPIKNVVIVFLESTRYDMMPFNASSIPINKTLREEALKEDITPFMRELVNKSRYTNKGKSVSSFTAKAIIGGVCSVYPYPENYDSESRYEFYKMCLPKLLEKYANMSSAFINPLIVNFYKLEDIMAKAGFQEIIGAERIAAGEFGIPPNKFLIPLGYDDGFYLKVIHDWVQKQIKNNKNFLLTYATSATHEPFVTPTDWQGKKLSNNYAHNKYLNAIAYSDWFLNKLIDDFKEQGLLNNTLFVILGDHGISLGEHDSWITTDIPYETSFSISMLLYTENKEWNTIFPPGKFNEQWTTIDILPTIIDALQFDGTNKQFKDKYDYEGQSILRAKYERRVQLSFTNPGISSIIAREGNWKIILPGTNWVRERVYNLEKDEYELEALDFESLEPEVMNWVKDMRFVREIYTVKVKEWYENATPRNSPLLP